MTMHLISQKESLHWKGVQALGWNVQGGYGVTIPGGIPEKAEHGTLCYVLVEEMVIG